jgi:hypothetical protein
LNRKEREGRKGKREEEKWPQEEQPQKGTKRHKKRRGSTQPGGAVSLCIGMLLRGPDARSPQSLPRYSEFSSLSFLCFFLCLFVAIFPSSWRCARLCRRLS